MLLIAMITGALLNGYAGHVAFLVPWLIFVMLLLSFLRLSPRDIKFNRLHFIMLAIQLAGSVVVYLSLSLFNITVAQGAMICILIPTATSAVVITGMLGGNKGFLTVYTLLGSLAFAVAAPVIFSFVGSGVGGAGGVGFGSGEEVSAAELMIKVAGSMGLLLVLPLVTAWTIRAVVPGVDKVVSRLGDISFYLWAFALAVVTGNTVKFLTGQGRTDYKLEIGLALTAMIICVMQFALGRHLGRKYTGDPISAGQGLGQKNTILAIWMAQTYLNPLASVAPATYVIWQNIINSYQLWRKAQRS